MGQTRFKEYEDLLPKNSFYRNSQIISEYGSNYEHFIKNSILVKDPQLFNKYKTSNLITITTQNGEKTISEDLLLDLLSIEGLYRYLITNMDNEISIAARIDYFLDGEIKESIQITRADLSIFLDKLDINKLNPQLRMRIALITNMTSFFSLGRMYGNMEHIAVVDGEMICVNTNDLLGILSMNDVEFNQFIYGKNPYNYSKEIMLYMLIDFIKRNRLIEKYYLSEPILNRYRAIENQEILDFESLNKNLKANDTDYFGVSFFEQVIIDSSLKEELFKYCKDTYSNLEKALHVYVRLCEILEYDQGYFASPKLDVIKELETIRNVSLTNNTVTNYEFLMIYAKLLKELGIRYTLDNNLIGGNADEATITFRSQEYLVKINSIKDSENNDLVNAKINAPLTGLYSINHNDMSKRKFDELFYKIIQEYIENKTNQELFESSLEAYHNKYAHALLPFKDRLYILLKDIARPNLKGVEAIRYQEKIFNNLFGNDPRITINFISSMINNYKDYTYTPLTIITITVDDKSIYYLIDPNNQNIVEQISKSELEEYFISGDYAYLGTKDEIPNLDLDNTGGVKYVR